MEGKQLQHDLGAWYDRGDREAGARVVQELSARVALPASFGRALGASVAEEVEQDTLVRLLDRERRLLLDAQDPLAFAATVARNLARDTLRKHRRRGDQGDDREAVHDIQLPAREPSRDAPLDAARALAMLNELGEDSRLAVYLHHAPDRMPDDEWELVMARHPVSGDLRCPDGPLDRDETSRLLWPPPLAETRDARRRRLERLRKVLQRAYARLAEALGAA